MYELLDFYADWCGPCQIMKPIFAEVEPAFEGKISFKTVDVEADPDKAVKFGVMGIPTFVVLKDGKEVDRKTGAMPKESLVTWLKTHVN
ncbi:thioredoxin fold domain-containing protein [candidate division WWE3 bacterium]|nr:thioredoxin fold domain-containing protein [candidate division WWE3 bacterium]